MSVISGEAWAIHCWTRLIPLLMSSTAFVWRNAWRRKGKLFPCSSVIGYLLARSFRPTRSGPAARGSPVKSGVPYLDDRLLRRGKAIHEGFLEQRSAASPTQFVPGSRRRLPGYWGFCAQEYVFFECHQQGNISRCVVLSRSPT